MKYQCYYHKNTYYNGRKYIGERVNTKCFDTEAEAELYCMCTVGTTDYGDGSYDEHEMLYEEVE